MATQSQVNDYVGYIREELSKYGRKLATMHQHGSKPSFAKELKFMLLQAYVEIAESYLDQWNSTTDDNFFTISEFETIMEHINSICNSHHWLELE